MPLRAGLIQINVTDLAEARRFFRDAVGVPLRERFGPDGPFELVLDGGTPVLVYRVERSVPVEYGRDTGVTVVFFTDRIEEAVRRMAARGVTFLPIPWSPDESGIAPCPYGRFIAFRDPSGNVHELLEPKVEGPAASCS